MPRDTHPLVLTPARLATPRMNRRRCIRYPLRALAIFQWECRDGSRKQARGWTKDLSETGAYIVSSQCPGAGEPVELLLRFPVRTPLSGGHVTNIDMDGRVLRVDRDPVGGRELGFAVRKREQASNLEFDRLEARQRGEEPEGRLKPLRTN